MGATCETFQLTGLKDALEELEFPPSQKDDLEVVGKHEIIPAWSIQPGGADAGGDPVTISIAARSPTEAMAELKKTLKRLKANQPARRQPVRKFIRAIGRVIRAAWNAMKEND